MENEPETIHIGNPYNEFYTALAETRAALHCTVEDYLGVRDDPNFPVGQAIKLKEKANTCHREGRFDEAIKMYTKAMTLAIDESNANS